MALEKTKLKRVLKKQLRNKKLKYTDLAEHLECSVPTVKRILGDEELSVSRLLEILEFLNLSFTDLEMLAANEEAVDLNFSKEQEEFLAKSPHFFAYLSRLYHGETPQTLAEKYKLSTLSTNRYILALEKVGLIRVTGKQRVKPVYERMPRLGRGQLAKAFYAAFIQAGADFFIKTVGDSLFAPEEKEKVPRSFTIHAGLLRMESYKQFVEQQKKLFDDLVHLSNYQQKAFEKSELCSFVVMQGQTVVAHDHPGLTRLTDVFGQVTNI